MRYLHTISALELLLKLLVHLAQLVLSNRYALVFKVVDVVKMVVVVRIGSFCSYVLYSVEMVVELIDLVVLI